MSIPILSIDAAYDNPLLERENQYTIASANNPSEVLDYSFQIGEENNLRISGFTDINAQGYGLIETINQIFIFIAYN